MIVAEGSRVRLRRLEARDLAQCAPFIYSLSIQEPLTELARNSSSWATAVS